MNKIYKFGEFWLDVTDRTLWRERSKVSLSLKAIEMLILLVENQGRTVTKAEILEKLWNNTYVEENILAVMVSSLRKALSEKKDDSRFIETVPRRGYRFVHEIEESEELIENPSITKITFESRHNSDIPQLQRQIHLQTILLTLIGVLMFSLAGFWVYANWFYGNSTRVKASTFKANYGTPSTASALKTVLILPFNQINTNGQTYSKEFAQNLIIRLGSLNKFSVRPLYTVANEQTQIALGQKKIIEKADFVLDGTIELVEENKFRVAVNLFDVKNNSILWTENLTETDSYKLQETISAQTANQIINTLTPSEKAKIDQRQPTTFPAYFAYLKGLERLRNRTDCIVYFLEAIKEDPNFAPAYAMLANARAFDGGKGSPQAIEAKNYLDKSLALDNSNADAFAVQGFMQIFHEFDWEGGEKSLRRAIELDPRNVNAHHWLACLMSIHRQLDEAKAEMEKALEFDPVSPTLIADLGELFYFAGQNEEAISLCKQALALDPNNYFARGHLNRINTRHNFDREGVLKDLENKANLPSFALAYINVDPFYDPIRNDYRFQRILQKVNIAQ